MDILPVRVTTRLHNWSLLTRHILLGCWLLPSLAGLQAQSLAGNWEGKLYNDKAKYDFELNIISAKGDIISGVVEIFKRVSFGEVIQSGNSSKESSNAQMLFIGKVSGKNITINELSIAEKDGPVKWCLKRMTLQLTEGKKAPALAGKWTGECGQGTLELEKKTDKIAKNVLKNHDDLTDPLRTDSLRFYTRDQDNQLRDDIFTLNYNSNGYVSLYIRNKLKIATPPLYCRLVPEGTYEGVLYSANKLLLSSLKPGQSNYITIPFGSAFNLPEGPLHFTIAIGSEDIPLTEQKVTLHTVPFFTTGQFTKADLEVPRLKAIGVYYGFQKGSYKDALSRLSALALQKDSKSIMWNGIYNYLGLGGAVFDEDLGIELIKSVYPEIEKMARAGDVEAIYLLSHAYEMGLEGSNGKSFAPELVRKAMLEGFPPAVYDHSLRLFSVKKYEDARNSFEKAISLGVTKGYTAIGTLYEARPADQRDIREAIKWYTKGIDNNDPDAMLKMAVVKSTGLDIEPDIKEAISLATKAAVQNHTGAMVFIGNLYLNGKKGVAQDGNEALKWFKKAADLGDREGMMALGILYDQPNTKGIVQDETSSLFWTKKAAELGQPQSMAILGGWYFEGKKVEKNIIKGRYWMSQAQQKGVGVAKDSRTSFTNDFLNFWRYADFSPNYYIVRDAWGDERIESSGPDIIGGFVTGMLGMYTSRYGSQQIINGFEFIYSKKGKKIYAGTITSRIKTGLVLKPNQRIYFSANGTVSLGVDKQAGPDGVPPGSMCGFFMSCASFSIVRNINHGALMGNVGGNMWYFFGRFKNFVVSKGGELFIAVNDTDYGNNQGYFDFQVEVFE